MKVIKGLRIILCVTTVLMNWGRWLSEVLLETCLLHQPKFISLEGWGGGGLRVIVLIASHEIGRVCLI
jgi:hypothetical protein